MNSISILILCYESISEPYLFNLLYNFVFEMEIEQEEKGNTRIWLDYQ